MKKLIVLCSLLLCVTVLGGCGSDEKTQTVCTYSETEGSMTGDITTTIDASGDEVSKMKQEVKMDGSMYKDSGYSKEEIEKVMEDEVGESKAKGITYDVSMDDNWVMTMSITVDLSKASNSDLVEAGILSVIDKDADYISLEETVKNIKEGSDNAKCKETKK